MTELIIPLQFIEFRSGHEAGKRVHGSLGINEGCRESMSGSKAVRSTSQHDSETHGTFRFDIRVSNGSRTQTKTLTQTPLYPSRKKENTNAARN